MTKKSFFNNLGFILKTKYKDVYRMGVGIAQR